MHRHAHDRSLRQGIACDPQQGCIGKLADGSIVAYAVEPAAFKDDCARANLILAVHDDPPSDWPPRQAREPGTTVAH